MRNRVTQTTSTDESTITYDDLIRTYDMLSGKQGPRWQELHIPSWLYKQWHGKMDVYTGPSLVGVLGIKLVEDLFLFTHVVAFADRGLHGRWGKVEVWEITPPEGAADA